MYLKMVRVLTLPYNSGSGELSSSPTNERTNAAAILHTLLYVQSAPVGFSYILLLEIRTNNASSIIIPYLTKAKLNINNISNLDYYDACMIMVRKGAQFFLR